MKKLLIILLTLVSVSAFAQPGAIVVPRSPKGIAPQDANFYATFNLKLPVFADTASANAMMAHDSLGLTFYNKADTSVYVRAINSAGSHNYWKKSSAPPGGSVNWGSIGGTLSSQTDLSTALAGKQASLTIGTTAQYFRGDLSLATFPTNLSAFTNGPGYLTAAAVKNSIIGTGVSGSELQLSGDAATPGATKYYGTDGGGTKGWYTLSIPGTGTVTSLTALAPLTGGTITTTGSIGIDTGAGKIATKTDVAAKVASVLGTTNRITSSGGVNPAIDISPTFEALLGKVANRIDQNNASTSSTQLASIINDEYGSGLLLFAPAANHNGMKLGVVGGVPTWQDTTAASGYTLPTATTSVLGGVKIDGTTITISGGVISATSPTSIPPNLGVGFRIYAPQTPGFKTLVPTTSAGIKIDSSSTTLNLAADTLLLATKSWVTSLTTTFNARFPGTGVPVAYVNNGAYVQPFWNFIYGFTYTRTGSDSTNNLTVDTTSSGGIVSKTRLAATILALGGGLAPGGSPGDMQWNNTGVFAGGGPAYDNVNALINLIKSQNNEVGYFVSNTSTGAAAVAKFEASNGVNSIKMGQYFSGNSYSITPAGGSFIYSNAPVMAFNLDRAAVNSEMRFVVGPAATTAGMTLMANAFKMNPAILPTGSGSDSVAVYHALDSSWRLVAQSSISGGGGGGISNVTFVPNTGNYTATTDGYFDLADLTGQANRNFVCPAASSKKEYFIKNNNTSASGFTWTFTSRTVKDFGNNTVTTVPNLTVVHLVDDGTNLNIVN